jgi:hypothetical protein
MTPGKRTPWRVCRHLGRPMIGLGNPNGRGDHGVAVVTLVGVTIPPDQPYTVPIIVPGPPAPPRPPSPEPPPAARRPGWVVPVIVTMAILVVASLGSVAYLVAANRRSGAAPAAVAPPMTTAALSPPAAKFDVAGTLFVAKAEKDGTGCKGSGGFSDIYEGAQVVVTDPAGTVVGVGVVSAGIPGESGTTCTFLFSADDVPAGKGFYGIKIGNRPVRQMGEAELHQRLDLSLGL